MTANRPAGLLSALLAAAIALWLQKPKIVSAATHARRASVYMGYPTDDGPYARYTFAMRREARRWRLAYDFYLANRLRGK